jgi:hypothetical protein
MTAARSWRMMKFDHRNKHGPPANSLLAGKPSDKASRLSTRRNQDKSSLRSATTHDIGCRADCPQGQWRGVASFWIMRGKPQSEQDNSMTVMRPERSHAQSFEE